VNPTERIVRRANVDDLTGLRLLWERAHLQVLDLEKRLTEFQLVSTPGGDLIGVIALHIDGKLGRLYGEAFTHPEQADDARPWLWERLQTLARNHGLVRLWTLEAAPFWHHAGFTKADPEQLRKLPESFGDRHSHWLTLALREESVQAISIEKEFEIFQQSQRAQTEQVLAQARRLKLLAYVVTFVVAIIALVGLFFVFSKTSQSTPSRAPNRMPP
jgi:N-acetylglutamate synthase-like GNAT family acetyltransferase